MKVRDTPMSPMANITASAGAASGWGGSSGGGGPPAGGGGAAGGGCAWGGGGAGWGGGIGSEPVGSIGATLTPGRDRCAGHPQASGAPWSTIRDRTADYRIGVLSPVYSASPKPSIGMKTKPSSHMPMP